jgi:hypothetical protein
VVVRLTVRHAATFRYPRPMRMLVHSLRLTPSRFDGQKSLRWTVSAKGGREGAEFRDGAGDLVRTLSVRGPATEVTVERRRTSRAPRSPPTPAPRSWRWPMRWPPPSPTGWRNPPTTRRRRTPRTW